MHIQDHLELEPQVSVPKLSTQINISGLTCKNETTRRHTGTPRNQTSIQASHPISDSLTKTLRILAELEQRTESQTAALQNLKKLSPALSLNRPLLKEIKTHRLEMEAILATLTALWCEKSSVAAHLKQELRSKLQENIDDSRLVEGVLTNASPSGAPITARKVIDVDRPGKVLDRERTVHYTDISDRQTFYQLLARLQLPPAAVSVPSTCPRLSGPLDSALK